jgi:transcriptional regulator with XRE-family HTH domain
MDIRTNSKPVTGSIRAARIDAGLSQQELAARAGCSVSFVGLLEGGYLPANSDVLPRVLSVIGLSMVTILRREIGMTAGMFALQAGIKEELLAQIESGEAAPSRTEKEAIAGVLEISVDRVFPAFPRPVRTGLGGDTREP